MRYRTVIATLAFWLSIASAMGAVTPPAIEGKDLGNASLPAVHIDSIDGTHLTVVAFLSARCPCSASHESVLSGLAHEYGKEARFVGIHSNSDEPIAESGEHFKKSALPFPVLQDEGARIADRFGAVKTPHVFVLAKNGDIVFQGGVDDSHDASRATKNYLKSALQALREGHAPEITLTRSLGCKIRR